LELQDFCRKDGNGGRMALALLNLKTMDGHLDDCGSELSRHGFSQ